MVNVPSSRVIVPSLVPSISTLTPAMGCWVVLSTTCPVMVPVDSWAPRGVRVPAAHRRAPARRMRRRATIIGGALHQGGSQADLTDCGRRGGGMSWVSQYPPKWFDCQQCSPEDIRNRADTGLRANGRQGLSFNGNCGLRTNGHRGSATT